MKEIETPIVPLRQSFYRTDASERLDWEALCGFVSVGFFMEDDTYFENWKVLKPGSRYVFDGTGNKVKETRQFRWYYEPRNISFDQVVDEFTDLFESIVDKQCNNKKIILPISGGLDSRCLAAAVKDKNVFGYSYSYQHGADDENKYASAVARVMAYNYQPFMIPQGYLWSRIEKLAEINQCYAEFTNPRQMSIYNQVKDFGDIFLLGHCGDLFFDGMGVNDALPQDQLKDLIVKKHLKPGGVELAERLWAAFSLPGNYSDYIRDRLHSTLSEVNIPQNANSTLRAHKTEYYIHRWSIINLSVFADQREISLPFTDDRMCKFICSIPEEYLNGRQIEIAYLKRKSKALAKIPWQKYDPCNLYTYKDFYSWKYLPLRAFRKMRRKFNAWSGQPLFNSNWQLQFLGPENNRNLKRWLLEEPYLANIIPADIVKHFYDSFQVNPKVYYHPVTMLLTLALFSKLKGEGKIKHQSVCDQRA